MGWVLMRRVAVVAAVALFTVACDTSLGDSLTPTPTSAALPLAFSGGVLHSGDYCHFLVSATPGNNTLPIINGCQFNLTKPADLIATDGSHYSVSEVVGTAQLGVRGPADSRVIVGCRIAPRGLFWFWISADGHWNISNVGGDIHHPQDLVSVSDEEPLRQFIKVGALNDLQFRCAGGAASTQISLAMNLNGQQFVALRVSMPLPAAPLDKPDTPWFVEIGARLPTAGTLEGTVAKVVLYNHE